MSKPYAELRPAACRTWDDLLRLCSRGRKLGALTGLLLAAVALAACSSTTAPKPETAEATAATAPKTAVKAVPIPEGVQQAYSVAQTLMQAGDWPAAETSLRALVDSNPDLPGPAVNLGIVYVHLKRPDDARKMFESAVKRWPDFAPGQHQLGLLLSSQGEFEAADAAYARAVAADPNYAAAYYNRAVLNELYLQKLPVALQCYEQFQRLQPKPDEQVARWIADLRRRTGTTQPAAKPATNGTPAS